MSEITKPSNLSLIWASAGDILNPGDTKYQTGWQVEIPPRQWENYIQNKQDQAIAHINQHGIPVWDAATEYQANKSYVQGPTNGTIYQCILTNTNQDPELDVTNTYWIVAFAAAGTFYTKAEADTKFLDAASNLSDLTNTATARTNLSVYAKSETYSKTEVDNKTTVATTLQAQQQNSNSVLLSALRLAEAFKGANQSLTASGFQRIPGGLAVQWGFVATQANLAAGFEGSLSTNFATQFTGGTLIVLSSASTQRIVSSASSFTDTSVTIGYRTLDVVPLAQQLSYIAIGIA